jgi:hypothetical protein
MFALRSVGPALAALVLTAGCSGSPAAESTGSATAPATISQVQFPLTDWVPDHIRWDSSWTTKIVIPIPEDWLEYEPAASSGSVPVVVRIADNQKPDGPVLCRGDAHPGETLTLACPFSVTVDVGNYLTIDVAVGPPEDARIPNGSDARDPHNPWWFHTYSHLIVA